MFKACKIYWKQLGMGCLLALGLQTAQAEPFQLNEDGRHLIQQARQAFDSDMRDRPVVMDGAVKRYVQDIVQRLMPSDASPPQGVVPDVTVLDSPKPMIYTYVDGHMVVSSGLIYGLDNEAQLAGVLAPQVAHLSQGYYLAMYQQIKAVQRKKARGAIAGALFGVLLDAAVDYTVDFQGIDMTEDVMSGKATYGETMKRLAAMEAGQSAYYGIKDIISNIPAKDSQGKAIDPRLQFEPVADAQGAVYCARSGYDPGESARGWENVMRISQRMLKDQEQMMGAFAEQLRAHHSLMESNLQRLRQQMGDTGLVQTPSHVQPSRAQFVAGLTRLDEVRDVLAKGKVRKGKASYQAFIQEVLLVPAQQAMDEERYEEAHKHYRLLYDRGVRTAPVAYGLAKSKLGDFAFGASPAELRAAEKAYREAIRLDTGYAEPYRGLAELYSDTDDYEAAIEAWQAYLKLVPKALDRKKIERKLKTLRRKASR